MERQPVRFLVRELEGLLDQARGEKDDRIAAFSPQLELVGRRQPDDTHPPGESAEWPVGKLAEDGRHLQHSNAQLQRGRRLVGLRSRIRGLLDQSLLPRYRALASFAGTQIRR